MKKWLAFVLVLLMVPVCCFTAVAGEEEEAGEKITIDGYGCVILDDGTLEIDYLTEKIHQQNKIAIPATLGGKKVTRLGSIISGENTLQKEPKVVSITLPDSIEYVSGQELDFFTNLKEIVVSAKNPYFMCINGILFSKEGERLVCYPRGITDSSYVIPDGTQTIGADAFCYSQFSQISIPESVVCIEGRAFRNCNHLTDIVIPDSVKTLENPCIYCRKLKSISISPDNPYLEIIDGVVYDKTNKSLVCTLPGWSEQSFAIPDSVTSIGDYAFSCCESLKEITIPEGVTSIGARAFDSCESLKEITIPEGVTSIEDNTFNYCASLEKITIPEGVTSIGNRAFWLCGSLKEITLPNSLTSIGERAFYKCSSLTEITIPEGVVSIGNNAFRYCRSLTEITIPFGVTSIEEFMFFGDDALQKVTLPDSVTTIGVKAFAKCRELTSITIPDSVTTIELGAFWKCKSLAEIVIPSSVVEIGENAFINCDLLTVKVTKDSCAMEYCKKNNIKYEIID